jgi:hypothetical protein
VLGYDEAFPYDTWLWRSADYPGAERYQRSDTQFRLRLGMKSKGAKAKTLNARLWICETLYLELQYPTKQANACMFHIIPPSHY